MKRLCVQIQPERSPGLNTELAVERLSEVAVHGTLATSVDVVRGEDDGSFINVSFTTPDVRALWLDIRESLLHGHPDLCAALIVTCEGEAGWDDYLLLHHFDPTEETDEMENH